ncbi:hypothetical protein [Clostridium sp.]
MDIKDIKVGQSIKFGIMVKSNIKNLKGKVFAVNTNHFTVQHENFKESYQFNDIVTEVKLCN